MLDKNDLNRVLILTAATLILSSCSLIDVVDFKMNALSLRANHFDLVILMSHIFLSVYTATCYFRLSRMDVGIKMDVGILLLTLVFLPALGFFFKGIEILAIILLLAVSLGLKASSNRQISEDKQNLIGLKQPIQKVMVVYFTIIYSLIIGFSITSLVSMGGHFWFPLILIVGVIPAYYNFIALVLLDGEYKREIINYKELLKIVEEKNYKFQLFKSSNLFYHNRWAQPFFTFLGTEQILNLNHFTGSRIMFDIDAFIKNEPKENIDKLLAVTPDGGPFYPPPNTEEKKNSTKTSEQKLIDYYSKKMFVLLKQMDDPPSMNAVQYLHAKTAVFQRNGEWGFWAPFPKMLFGSKYTYVIPNSRRPLLIRIRDTIFEQETTKC